MEQLSRLPELYGQLPDWTQELIPIAILLALIGVILVRLPKVELGYTKAFTQRRFMNWFPLGLTYAFLYMGRYNLNIAQTAFPEVMTKEMYGTIGMWGTLIYGCSFVINGPLADKIGGRKTILIAAVGSAVMNIIMGMVLRFGYVEHLVPVFSALYAANMYFQSFGAVSIVKVNASWFHVNERGVIGGVFGVLISLGIYFAFDWNSRLIKLAEYMGLTAWQDKVPIIYFVPAALLLLFFVIDYFIVRDTPSDAGHEDIYTADASEGQAQLTVLQVAKKMLTNPIILTIAAIEFCSGFLRNSIMQWGKQFAKDTGQMDAFVFDNWGLMLCIAGITGGMLAGVISDRVFQSRRGPVAAVLYGGMVAGALVMFFVIKSPLLGWLVVLMSLCVIGVHGMLSGTASMDFGGKKNAGIAVGIIDGCVYLGTALQYAVLGKLLPHGDAAHDAGNWSPWPLVMIPVAVVGFFLATRIWHAKPKPKAQQPKASDDAATADTS